MALSSYVLIAVAIAAALVLLQPRLLRAGWWRAVVTPLASIIGSGFLVAGPILSHVAGKWAFIAMLVLCGMGYLFGSAVRYNIVHIEPKLKHTPSRRVAVLEQLSGLALAFAYFVSVAYYLNLFSAFALRGFGITSEIWIKSVTSAVLLVLSIAGATGGLRAFERIETLAVGLKLAVIAGLLVALAQLDGASLIGGTLSIPTIDHAAGWDELRVVLGLVVLVQGFETSRYLGAEHGPRVRVRTMVIAQVIATGIYVAFIVLATPYFGVGLKAEGGETAIIDLLAPLGLAVAPALIIAALASQLSAAVADLNGSGGLLIESLGKWLSLKWGYAVTIIVALVITWTANIYEIISYASRAFVAYYALQSLQALMTAWFKGDNRNKWRVGLFGGSLFLALATLVFAQAASV